jgi:hypothetical protein
MSSDKREPDDQSSSPPRSHFGLPGILGLPRAIWEHGNAHGRDLRQATNREENRRRDETRNDSETSKWDALVKRQEEEAYCKEGPVDRWVREELERGSRIAKEMYDSWDPTPLPPQKQPEAQSSSTFNPFSPFETMLNMITAMEEAVHNPKDLDLFARLFSNEANVHTNAAQDMYSPQTLEDQPGFDRTWRVRFEDLIRADQGIRMLNKEEAEQSMKQRKGDWMERFLKENPRGEGMFMATKMCEQFRPTSADCKRNAHLETEEDAFEYFLKQQTKSELASGNGISETTATRLNTEPNGSVTLTATTTTIYADGRVETREESQNLPNSHIPPRWAKRLEQESSPKEEKTPPSQPTPTAEKKGGWFWSS